MKYLFWFILLIFLMGLSLYVVHAKDAEQRQECCEPNKPFSGGWGKIESKPRRGPEGSCDGESLIYEQRDSSEYFSPITLSDIIPNAPDYIELPKNLVLHASHMNDPNEWWVHHSDIIIEKGTRIYFEENP